MSLRALRGGFVVTKKHLLLFQMTSLVPSIHVGWTTATCSSSSRECHAFFWLLYIYKHKHPIHVRVCAHAHTHITNKINLFKMYFDHINLPLPALVPSRCA